MLKHLFCLGAIAPIVNSAYQGNYSPMKKFGMGGFGGHENYAGGVSIFYKNLESDLVQ